MDWNGNISDDRPDKQILIERYRCEVEGKTAAQSGKQAGQRKAAK